MNMYRSFLLRALLLAAALPTGLAACGHMPVTSMVKLARIDFVSSDPAQLRAAVKLPRTIEPRPQGLVMRVTVKLANGQEEAQDFPLREVSDPADVLALHGELDPGTHLYAYRLDAGEVARVTAFRDALKKRQEATGKRGGALTIAIRPDSCRTAELPDAPVYVTTYLKTAETGGYVTFARDVDLRTILPGRDIAAEIPPCGDMRNQPGR
jgi:hypothetical protein